jgi:hypothetical protein
MAQDSVVVSKAQRVYMEGIFDAYSKQADFLRYFQPELEEVPTNYLGRQITIETKANPSLAFGNLDGGDLATPSNPTLDNLLVTYQWMNSGFEETYGAILNNNKETVDDPFQKAVKSSAKQFSQWLNYYLSAGNGTTALATASANYAGGTPTIFTANGATDSFGATRVVDGQRGFIYDPTGTTQRVGTVGAGVLTIASHTKTAITFTTNAPSDFIIGDIFVPEGGNQIGIKGLPYLVNNTGDYFNKSRTAVPQLQSQVISVGGALSAAALLQLETTTSFVSDDAIEDGQATMCCALAQWYAYQNLVTPISFQHYDAGRPQADIGAKSFGITWFGRPIKAFKWLSSFDLYRLKMDGFKMATLKKVGQLDPRLPAGGGEWMQKLSTTAGNYAAARQRWMDAAMDAYHRQPFLLGKLTGLTAAFGKQKGD